MALPVPPALGREAESLMAIRRGEEVFVYLNTCPHWGLPLDIQPGRFLDRSGELILCSTHGALFTIETGNCVRGPCLGATLVRIPVRVEDGTVTIAR